MKENMPCQMKGGGKKKKKKKTVGIKNYIKGKEIETRNHMQTLKVPFTNSAELKHYLLI